jgi:hypothetical protein
MCSNRSKAIEKKTTVACLMETLVVDVSILFFTFIAKACGHLDKRTRTRMTSQTRV